MDYEMKLPNYRISLAISNLKKKKNDNEKDNENDYRPIKRKFLLVSNRSSFTHNVFNPKKIQKIE